MVGHVCLIACLIAICIPIISVQLPRCIFYPKLRSKSTESGPSILSSWQVALPHMGRRVTRATTIPERTAAAETSCCAETYDGAQSRAASGSAENGGESAQASALAVRKPWDPPFPQRESVIVEEISRRNSGWRSLPPLPPRRQGTDMERAGTAKRLFPPDLDGDLDDDIDESAEAGDDNEHEVQVSNSKRNWDTRRANKTIRRGMSRLWLFIWALAILLFILSFAILIAHCLAWFLVYKTEARLGEARRGIVQGGNMRLCLCAT